MRLDSHIHLWSLDDGQSHWMRDKIAGLHRDFTESDLRDLTGKCSVDYAIVVQAHHTKDETFHWLERANINQQLAGVIGYLDLLHNDFEKDLESFLDHPKFVGLRPLPNDTFGGDWFETEAANASMQILNKKNVSVDTLQPVENLTNARKFFRKFAGLKLVLNHAGRPAVMTGELKDWKKELILFAKETNALVKCSGLVERAGVEWTKKTISPYVETIIEVFGSDRVMFGTNWPVMTISSTYDLWVNTLFEILTDLKLSQEIIDNVMGKNAANHYGLSGLLG